MGKPRTAAQIDATMRNHRIRTLRALQASCGMLPQPRAKQVRDIVDEELRDMGAKTFAEHARDVADRFDRERGIVDIDEEELPF